MFMVFDIESVGLHGEGFAVGWVIVTAEGKEIGSGFESIDPFYCEGDQEGRAFIKENVIPHLPPPTIDDFDPAILRTKIWNEWLFWKEKKCSLWADFSWPVEARFLSDCVDDANMHPDLEDRRWEGPYPLNEISTVMLAANMDPFKDYDRLPAELPKHHPTCDARQSARLLIMAKKRLNQCFEVLKEAELVAQYCQANGLTDCSSGWKKILVMPEERDR